MNNPMQLIMQVFSGQANPQQVLDQLARTNPQANAMLNQMRQSGMTPQQFATQYAKQKGVNINGIVDMLHKRGMKF